MWIVEKLWHEYDILHKLILISKISTQVLNPQKDGSDTHSFKLIHTYIVPEVTYLRSESSNISLVVLDMLLVGFPER